MKKKIVKERVSATIDPETKEMLDVILKKRNYRNISHIIEDAIKLLADEVEKDE
jgi:Arc/MetJ-type ribon-helix-helix transcriptional regulator